MVLTHSNLPVFAAALPKPLHFFILSDFPQVPQSEEAHRANRPVRQHAAARGCLGGARPNSPGLPFNLRSDALRTKKVSKKRKP